MHPKIKALLDSILTPTESEIFQAVAIEEKPRKQVAEERSCSRGYVTKVYHKACRKLNHPIRDAQIKQVLEEVDNDTKNN